VRVLVTGASGFLGSRLVGRLLDAGCDATAVGRPAARLGLQARGCRVLEADIGARAAIADPGRHDAACLLAQSAAYRQGLEGVTDIVAVNLLGLARSLALARRAGVRRVVYFSSGSVYRPSFEPLREDDAVAGDGLYPMSKRMGEELAARFRDVFELCVVRPFIVYGPGQEDRMIPDLVSRVAAGRAVTVAPRRAGEREPSGLITTPCHVDDAARITVALLEADVPDVLNLAGHERVSVRDVARVAGERLGREPVLETLATPRTGDFVADATRLEKLLAPRFLSFAEGLAEVIEAAGLGPGGSRQPVRPGS